MSSTEGPGGDPSQQDIDATVPSVADAGNSARQQAVNLVGTLLNRRYKLTGLIGQGGMADVYIGEDLKLHKQLAVKVLSPEQQRKSSVVERFLLEARAASRVRHAHVVDITDFGETPDRITFFAMEYLDGEDLQDTLRREGSMSWERTRDVTLQILEALQAAHDAGMIHRDMKPHNCFRISRDGNPDYIKLIDFGLAKLQDADAAGGLTGTGVIMGTAHYMSPEQGMGSDVDHRCDVYAVGAMMYQMLTGVVPYDGHSAMSILYKHIHADLPSLGEGKADIKVPAAVEGLIHKAMSKDPAERFDSATQFAEAIRGVDGVSSYIGGVTTSLKSLPVDEEAPPPSKTPLYLGIGGAVAGVIGLVALLVASPWKAGGAEDGGSDDDPVVRAGTVAVADPANPTPTSTDEAQPPEAAAAAKAAAPPQPEPSGEPEAETEAKQAETEAEAAAEAEAPAEKTPAVAGPRSKRKIGKALSRTGKAVSKCGKKAGLFPGEKLNVDLHIGASGQVSNVKVSGAQTTAAGRACIEKAVKRAKLGKGTEQNTSHRFTI